jgi:hypothetical protein
LAIIHQKDGTNSTNSSTADPTTNSSTTNPTTYPLPAMQFQYRLLFERFLHGWHVHLR